MRELPTPPPPPMPPLRVPTLDVSADEGSAADDDYIDGHSSPCSQSDDSSADEIFGASLAAARPDPLPVFGAVAATLGSLRAAAPTQPDHAEHPTVRAALLGTASLKLWNRCDLPPHTTFKQLEQPSTSVPVQCAIFATHTCFALPSGRLANKSNTLHRFELAEHVSAPLNAKLEAWVLGQERRAALSTDEPGHGSDAGVSKTNQGGFQTYSDIFSGQEGAARHRSFRPCRTMHAVMSAAMDELGPSVYPDEHTRPRPGEPHAAEGWANVNRPGLGDHNIMHIHDPGRWSAVYFVADGTCRVGEEAGATDITRASCEDGAVPPISGRPDPISGVPSEPTPLPAPVPGQAVMAPVAPKRHEALAVAPPPSALGLSPLPLPPHPNEARAPPTSQRTYPKQVDPPAAPLAASSAQRQPLEGHLLFRGGPLPRTWCASYEAATPSGEASSEVAQASAAGFRQASAVPGGMAQPLPHAYLAVPPRPGTLWLFPGEVPHTVLPAQIKPPAEIAAEITPPVIGSSSAARAPAFMNAGHAPRISIAVNFVDAIPPPPAQALEVSAAAA